MITAMLLSFGVIFLAEFGDKSQLMALTFALRYRWHTVLAGIAAATAALFGVSVTIGHCLGSALPTHLVPVLSGVAFLLFGLWTLRTADEAGHATAGSAARAAGFPAIAAVTSAFLLAELGDKTMFTAVALAAAHQGLGVWLGATLAMVAADGLALAVGLAAGRHLPERLLHALSAYGFLLVGGITLGVALCPAAPLPLVVVAAALVPLAVAAVRALLRARRGPAAPAPVDQESVKAVP